MTGSDPNSDPQDLNNSPGAWHGIAINRAYPEADRLAAALKACDLYEARMEEQARHMKIALLNLSHLAAEFARAMEPLVLALADFQAEVNKVVNESD